jgi:hypothetical protein
MENRCTSTYLKLRCYERGVPQQPTASPPVGWVNGHREYWADRDELSYSGGVADTYRQGGPGSWHRVATMWAAGRFTVARGNWL